SSAPLSWPVPTLSQSRRTGLPINHRPPDLPRGHNRRPLCLVTTPAARLPLASRPLENSVDGDAASRTIDETREFSFSRHPPARTPFLCVSTIAAWAGGVGTAGPQ